MESDSYLTIENPSEGLFREKGSRFLSFTFPVQNEDEIQIILENIRKKYHDARHHCYAWRLGADMSHFRANDDGEPGNSAGKPILGQIQSFQLTNILVIVVRYFGGTLLGVGGLIQAYKAASMDAIKNAKIIIQYLYINYRLNFKYEDMNLVMSVIKDMNLKPWGQKFEIDCELSLKVRKSEENSLLNSFRHESSVKLKVFPHE
jgi:uncharacterized YigZ family protein